MVSIVTLKYSAIAAFVCPISSPSEVGYLAAGATLGETEIFYLQKQRIHAAGHRRCNTRHSSQHFDALGGYSSA
jgi:hypothetical protein